MQTAVGCLFCTSGCAICSPQRHGSEHWYTVGESSPSYQVRNVLCGRHPLGFSLNDHGTCGECAFASRENGFWRCTKLASSPVVRKRWRACEFFDEELNELEDIQELRALQS